MNITDTYGRTFKTLRVSLTNSCNLACTYCVSKDIKERSSQPEAIQGNNLRINDFVKIISELHNILQLETIRLTGGEPTLYKNIVSLILALTETGPKIKLTTNGFLLKNLLDKLPKNSLSSINVSLDAMDEDIFFQISRRRSLHKILEGIEAALNQGIEIKLNCVVIKGINNTQILPLMEYAKVNHVVIRFLELMKMGHVYDGNFNNFFSEEEILKVISSRYGFKRLERKTSSTANYWQTSNGQVFGIIANESSPFCNDCDRLRIDSHGNIYGCLSDNNPINIANYVQEKTAIQQKLMEALAQKQPARFVGSKLSMLEIGG